MNSQVIVIKTPFACLIRKRQIWERQIGAFGDLSVAMERFRQDPEIAAILDRRIRQLDAQIEQFLTVLEEHGWDLAQKRRREDGDSGK